MDFQKAAYVHEVVRRAEESVRQIEAELAVLRKRSPGTEQLQHLIWNLETRLVEERSKLKYPIDTVKSWLV